MRSFALALSIGVLGLTTSCSTFDGPDADPDVLLYPVGIAVHPSGDYLYVLSTNFDATYNTEQGGTITVIDTQTLTIDATQTVLLQSFGGELMLGNYDDQGNPRNLYGVTRGANNLVVLQLDETGAMLSCGDPDGPDARDGTRCDIPYLSDDPFGVMALPDITTPQGTRNLVAVASLTGNVTFVTMDDGDVSTALHDEVGVLSGASTMAVYPPTGELFVGGRFYNGIRGLRWADIPTEDALLEITPYVSSTLPIANAASTLEVRDIIFSPERERAYITTDRPDSIVILDMSLDEDGQPLGTYVDRIALQGSPSEAVLIEENGQDILYVVLNNSGTLIAVNIDTGVIEDTIRLGDNPFGLAADTTHRMRLYVTLFGENAVAVVDIDPSSPTFRTADVNGRIE